MLTDDATLLQRTSLEGISMWSRWQPDRSLFFNSFFIRGKENVIVDPLALEERDLETIRAEGGAAWIVITTRDHEREAGALAEKLGAKIAAPVLDGPEIKVKIDRPLSDGDTIGRLRVVQLAGMKSPGEIGLHVADCATVVVGDALWGDPPGSLRMVADEKLGDAKIAALSLRRLWALEPKHILVGDGHCIYGNAAETIGNYLESRGDVCVNIINVDDVFWAPRNGPGNFESRRGEVGLLIGARKLGYQLIEILPGKICVPMHGHTAEEELYIVMEGTATIRLPRGEFPIRKGDFIALPVGERAAHSIRNDTKEKCVVLALANIDLSDCCFYPDSDKLLMARGIMRRMVSGAGGVDLDYWHGEKG
jgi:uncharacterized cupin superfamily protein/glyoxylase-like metal-dependent hydrolase (beta-lactamase superfamily II)